MAADPLPEEMDTAAEQLAWHAQWGAVRSWATAGEGGARRPDRRGLRRILPGVRSTTSQLFVGVGVVVVVNAGFTVALARRSWTIRSAALAFLARVAANAVLVVVADWLIDRSGGDLDGGATLFFLSLISLITTLHDRYRPMLATRVMARATPRLRGARPL